MTTVYVPYTVTGPDGEPVELDLAAELSADGEVIGLEQVVWKGECGGDGPYWQERKPVPEWALRQIDMMDLADEVLRRSPKPKDSQ